MATVRYLPAEEGAKNVLVTLEDGYSQRFWVDLSEEEYIRRTKFMQGIGVSSAQHALHSDASPTESAPSENSPGKAPVS